MRTRRNDECYVQGNGGDSDKGDDKHHDGNALNTLATIMRLGKLY